jgi:DNA-binding response OmpR family regulator
MMNERERPLVVAADDDPDIVELVAIVLRRAGYDVVTAGDGAEALERIRDLVPDLCVLDGVMPRVPGFEILRILREEQETGGIKVLILTATVDEEREIRRHGVEPDAFMKKPFEGEALLAKVDGLLA